MAAFEEIRPLGKILVPILCSNPECRKTFTVELDDSRECLSYCTYCGKKYFVRMTGTGKLWIKTLHNLQVEVKT